MGYGGGRYVQWMDRVNSSSSRPLLLENPRCRPGASSLFQCDWDSRRVGAGVCGIIHSFIHPSIHPWIHPFRNILCGFFLSSFIWSGPSVRFFQLFRLIRPESVELKCWPHSRHAGTITVPLPLLSQRQLNLIQLIDAKRSVDSIETDNRFLNADSNQLKENKRKSKKPIRASAFCHRRKPTDDP